MATQSIGRVSILLKGVYSASTTYNKLDVVSYEGSSYCAKAQTNGNLPTDTEYWQKIAEKGDQGEQGETGETGATGATGNGISKIEKTASTVNVDTYTITFTDGTTFDFDITNGTGSDWSVIRNKPFSNLDNNSFKVVSDTLSISDSFKALVNSKITEPNSDGSTGQALITDGSGGRSWGNPNYVKKVKNNEFTVADDTGELALHSTITNKLSTLDNAIGDAWNKDKTYYTNDTCISGNKVYLAIQNNFSGEDKQPPNATYWKETSLSAINSDLTNKADKSALIWNDSRVSFSSPFSQWTTNSLKKFNGMVIFALSFQTTSAVTLGTEIEVGYVPEGFRPSSRQSVITSDGCSFVVNTNGKISYVAKETRPYSSVSLVYV